MSDVDTAALLRSGREAGLAAVGVASADAFHDVRQTLEARKQAGLHGEMAFTYRNPARSTEPRRSLPGARSLVVGALDFHGPPPEAPRRPGPHGRVAAYARADHYAALRRALAVMAGTLIDAGHRALVLVDQNNLVDRAAAHRAGLGWWGKSSNILVPQTGSMVVLGSVLTDAELELSDGPAPDGCGSCRRCLDACPTGAIVEPGVVDARRCLAWLVQAEGVFPAELRAALGDRIYGCDDCQDVCPPNLVRVRRSHAGGADDGADEAWVPVLDLLRADDDELVRTYGRWYIPRRDPRYLRRNALIVLGNVGDPADRHVSSTLGDYLAHPDPMLRAHAVWAARRLGLHSALPDHDPDPDVAAELARAVVAR